MKFTHLVHRLKATPACNRAGVSGPADHRWSLWVGVAVGAAMWLFGARPITPSRGVIFVAVAALALILERRAAHPGE